jgi:eukaryotic translation initiation factor 2C
MDDAPHEPADVPASPENGSPVAALEVVTAQLSALSMEAGADLSAVVVVVQAPIPLPGDSYKFPHRPGSGHLGTRCLVKANHFLAELPDKDLHQYDVRCSSPLSPDSTIVLLLHVFSFRKLLTSHMVSWQVAITPETTSRAVGRAVMEELVRLHKATYLGGRLPAYDGRKSLYTAGPLPFTSREFHITLFDEDDGSGAERSVPETFFRTILCL